MSKLFKIILAITVSLIAFLSAFIVYYSITSNDNTNTNGENNEIEDFYDSNVDPDGWI